MKKKIYIYRLFFTIVSSVVFFLIGLSMLILTITKDFQIKALLGSLFLISIGILLIWLDCRKYILLDYKNKLIKFQFKDFTSKSYVHALDIVDKIDVVLHDEIYMDFILFLKGETKQKITFIATYKESSRLKRNYKRIKNQINKAMKEVFNEYRNHQS